MLFTHKNAFMKQCWRFHH